jgi:hypothetical protein
MLATRYRFHPSLPLLFATCMTLFAVVRAAPAQSAESPDPAALVRAAVERIGGEAWRSMRSFESVAVAKTAMGEARIEFRFVEPAARQLVQTMPGGRGVIEMGVVDGIAWMGEPGRARAIDPKLAQEMAGGGDLQTLVHSLDTRFDAFELAGKVAIDGRDAWKVTMRPRQQGQPEAGRWTTLIDVADLTVLGLDIPAPPKDLAPNAREQFAQTIRFRDWVEVERAKDAAPPTGRASELPTEADAGKTPPARILAFRTAIIEAGGMKTELTFTRVAVDTLAKDAIRVPEAIEPMAPARPY